MKMTREEAIQVLNMVEAHGLADEAKRMAIESLSAEPSGDLISREETIKVVQDIVLDKEVIEAIKALPSAEPKGAKLINRHDVTTVIREECEKCNNMINDDLFMRIMSLPTSEQTDCTEFIEWLIEVVLDDENWDLNAVGYGEIIARKLKKLGLLEVKDGYYIRHIENNTKESDLVYRPSADRPKGEDWDKYSEKLWHLAYERGKNDRPKAEAASGYTEWLEKIIVEAETFERLCEDATDKEWCEKNCNYASIQAECLRHLYEVSKGEPETEPAPVVAYICDRRRCAICRGPDGGCDHTTDIKHAAHFKNVAGQYFERPYMEEEDDG